MSLLCGRCTGGRTNSGKTETGCRPRISEWEEGGVTADGASGGTEQQAGVRCGREVGDRRCREGGLGED